MDQRFFHVPVKYVTAFGTQRNRGADLVIMEIGKRVVAYSFRSGHGCKIGMIRRAPLLSSKRGEYFEVRGKKVFLNKNSPYGWVM